jgi:hypothetical protein
MTSPIRGYVQGQYDVGVGIFSTYNNAPVHAVFGADINVANPAAISTAGSGPPLIPPSFPATFLPASLSGLHTRKHKHKSKPKFRPKPLRFSDHLRVNTCFAPYRGIMGKAWLSDQ